jgi:hypothetical protein
MVVPNEDIFSVAVFKSDILAFAVNEKERHSL